MPQPRILSPQLAKGQYGGPRQKMGNYLVGNLKQTSGKRST